MHEIRLEHEFDAAHRIVGHEGKCARLHGHSYSITVTLTAQWLQEPGFVIDYGILKEHLDRWDHRTLLWEKDVLWIGDDLSSGRMEAVEVTNGVVRLPFNPTAENMAQHLAEEFAQYGGVTRATVTVRESARSAATFTADV